MTASLDYRLLDVGAARIAVASSLEAFHRHLDAVYPHQEVLDGSAFADVRMSLQRWQSWLAKQDGTDAPGASRASAAEMIRQYLADPKSVKLRPLPAIPPGAPI